MFSMFSCNREKVIQPQIKQLTEAVYASGSLVPEYEYKVTSVSEGYLQRSFVNEGDSVTKNQLLFTLDNPNQDAQVQAASELVQRTAPIAGPSSPLVRDIEYRLQAANIRLQNDSQQYERFKNLFDQNAISASTFEKYQLQFETTSKEIESLRQQLKNARLNSAIQLQQATNQLKVASTARNNNQIRSFNEGIVYEVFRETGDMVYPNQPIALIGSGNMIARLLVDEDDFQKVKVGQEVMITMDAYPDKVFTAIISKIYPILNKVEQSFRVDAIFLDPLPGTVYGLNVEANIVLNRNVKALVIPKASVLKGDTVLIKDGKKVSKVKIQTGVEDNDWVQVTSGLHQSSQLIILQ